MYADGVNQAARRKPALGAGPGRLGVGLGVAGEPPHPLQPRLGRPRRHSRGASARSYVWWDDGDARAVDRARRAGLRRRPSPRPRAGPTGRERPRRASAADDPFIMQTDGKAWLFAPLGPGRRAAADALRAAGVAGAQPALRAAGQPGRARSSSTPANPMQPVAEPATSTRTSFTTYRLTEHHTAGWDEPHAALPVRAAAGDASARSRPGWPRERGLEQRRVGHDRHRPDGDRGAGAGHRADAAAAASAAGSCTRSGCPTTGAATALTHRRLGQRPGQRDAGPERPHPGARSAPATSGPAAARGDRRCGVRRGATATGRHDRAGASRDRDTRTRTVDGRREQDDDVRRSRLTLGAAV